MVRSSKAAYYTVTTGTDGQAKLMDVHFMELYGSCCSSRSKELESDDGQVTQFVLHRLLSP